MSYFSCVCCVYIGASFWRELQFFFSFLVTVQCAELYKRFGGPRIRPSRIDNRGNCVLILKLVFFVLSFHSTTSVQLYTVSVSTVSIVKRASIMTIPCSYATQLKAHIKCNVYTSYTPYVTPRWNSTQYIVTIQTSRFILFDCRARVPFSAHPIIYKHSENIALFCRSRRQCRAFLVSKKCHAVVINFERE